MVKVRLPDGRVASFPDDMPREQIKAFVAQKYPNAYGEQSMPEFSPEALAQIEAGNRAYDDKSHLGWNVAGGFVSGMGEGNLSGMGRVASGLTFGASDWLDRKTGGNLAALDDRLQRRADAAGLGLANRIAKAGTEIVGNIAPGGAITRGLARAGVKSALGQAAVGGGIGGALYGATASDKLSDLPVNMLAGGFGGTVGGAALHSAISGIGTVGGLLRSNVKKGIDYVRSKFGDEYLQNMIDEATQKGVSLAEVADERGLKMVQMARQQTSAADDIVTQNAQAIKDNVSNKNTDTLNDMFGTKSGYKMAQEAEQSAMEKARPMFNDLESKGDLTKYETRNLPQQNFDRWFEGSKVVDENGNPLKLYHGTEADFDAFDMSKGRSKADIQGAFFSPYEIDAKGYGSKLKEVYLNIKNPADEQTAYRALRKYQGQNYAGLKARQDLQRQGFDGVFNGYDEYIAFEPNQIKSVNNSGAWSEGSSLTDAGWTPESQSKLGNVINSNDVIGDTIKKVKGSYSSLKGLPDTDARVILETRKLLSSQTKSADKTLAYQAKQALKEFDDALPADFRKGLEEANKIYKDNYQFSEAKESASDIFKKNISPEEFSDKFGKMTAEEKRALRGGLRDELFSIIENRANETLGWNRVVPKAVQSKIRRVMGVEEGNKLIEYAQGQLKSIRNLNKILGGSQTSEKQNLRDIASTGQRILDNPTGILGAVSRMIPWNNARNMGIARIMTNPSADLARSTYEQVASPRGWEAVYQALYNPRGFTKYNTALAAYLAGREIQQ